MKSIKEIIEIIRSDSRCQVLPASGDLQPLPGSDLAYPNDLAEFYNLCGGVVLFRSRKDNVSFKILPASEVLQTNMLVVGEPCEDDISFSWYAICKTDNGDYISIDTSKERSGRCYDSNFEIHGVAGSCPIIALSFSELLCLLYRSSGMDVFWKTRDYGDAYA
ncbi:SMI1/KNR4 family protein [Burkholderia ambifaria]|uniref:SMI1/KNR4 family protein n=1 Tax=Burkholderia ambifaria TaxID=152480 RepID=UPI001E2A9D66|nr:SMI1/KNR4 family protein [Burkholderia ambifaria]UEP24371.1 SMI1/KNR4 family protein [Burkholderia ambifaria]